MEFNKLETKTGAKKGAFLHLRHPGEGHLLYTGELADEWGSLVDDAKADDAQKVGVYVLGYESDKVRRKARAMRRERMKSQTMTDEQTDERGMAFVCSLVIGFEGIETDGKPLEASDGNKREFFSQSEGLIDQVLAFAKDRSNFFKRS